MANYPEWLIGFPVRASSVCFLLLSHRWQSACQFRCCFYCHRIKLGAIRNATCCTQPFILCANLFGPKRECLPCVEAMVVAAPDDRYLLAKTLHLVFMLSLSLCLYFSHSFPMRCSSLILASVLSLSVSLSVFFSLFDRCHS